MEQDEIEIDAYQCDVCGESWAFIPEDYEPNKLYPCVCPHCSMPVSQMVYDILKEEGFNQRLFKLLWKRMTK